VPVVDQRVSGEQQVANQADQIPKQHGARAKESGKSVVAFVSCDTGSYGPGS
jgi:hypothetical protein